MENEWFEIAYINFNKAILHGRVQRGRDKFGVNIEQEIEIVLSESEKSAICDLIAKHERALRKVYRAIADARYDEPGFGA